MKVISGTLKGRNITGYNIDGTRPTMDRVKESLFATIQNYIKDSICLDLFAGSGSLGIEAISNGAKYCYFGDNNKVAIRYINENIKKFNIEEYCKVILSDYKNMLGILNKNDVQLDLIFLDPPYKKNVINEVIQYILKNNMISQNGLIICELENNNLEQYDRLSVFKNKKYGYKTLVIYKCVK